MRAGKRDQIIVIETYGLGGDDGWGNPVPQFTTLGTFRAQIVQGSNEEFFRAGGVVETQAIVFRTRYVDGIRTADRIAYDGLYFNIQEVKEIGRRHGLELRCASTGEVVP